MKNNPHNGINSFGNRLKVVRKRLGLTQTEIANRLEIKQNTYNNWENDQREPSVLILNKLVSLFGININYLVTGSGDLFVSYQEDINIAAEPVVDYKFRSMIKKELGVETEAEIKNLGRFIKKYDELNGVRLTIFEQKKEK